MPCSINYFTILLTVGGVSFVSLAICAMEIGAPVRILFKLMDLLTISFAKKYHVA